MRHHWALKYSRVWYAQLVATDSPWWGTCKYLNLLWIHHKRRVQAALRKATLQAVVKFALGLVTGLALTQFTHCLKGNPTMNEQQRAVYDELRQNTDGGTVQIIEELLNEILRLRDRVKVLKEDRDIQLTFLAMRDHEEELERERRHVEAIRRQGQPGG